MEFLSQRWRKKGTERTVIKGLPWSSHACDSGSGKIQVREPSVVHLGSDGELGPILKRHCPEGEGRGKDRHGTASGP